MGSFTLTPVSVFTCLTWLKLKALISCDTVPKDQIGREHNTSRHIKNTEHIPEQLGYVMTGFSLGCLVGPPIGGALNDKVGYGSAFIFGMAVCAIDLTGRLFIIEKDVAAPWVACESSIEQHSSLHNGAHIIAAITKRIRLHFSPSWDRVCCYRNSDNIR
jgi:hypothetical protein